jgi:hypothetical protein
MSISSDACRSSLYNRSEVIRFEYHGYGDTTLSVLYGAIFENLEGNEISLQNVQISVVGSKQNTFSDIEGNFKVGMESGSYDILVSKNGYQSVLLKNYEAISDRVSITKIKLVKGKEKVLFDIPTKHF